ncbi:MAG: hypothetical protein GY708_12695 [Actinomycetia bacterium]|nr:hypothetical protein [Actinomycetes bacterium]
MRMTMAVLLMLVLLAGACGGDDETTSTTTVTADDTEETTSTTTAAVGDDAGIVVREDPDLVYLSDENGDWTLRVFYPDSEGPWPLVVVIPPEQSVAYAGEAIAARGAVAVVADAWARPELWVGDPAPHLYGEMDRAACIVGWAQAHAADYGADAAVTTVDGYSGGAMAAAWVGLGLADDSACPDKIVDLPVGLVLGESQFLFHHQRWDPCFESGDPEPVATVDGLINPDRWTVSPDLKVGLWSAAQPMSETRAVENPPDEDSWIWLRDGASPFMDDFVAVGAFDDNRIDWSDNADLMELRMEQSGVDVRNEVYPIGHSYEDRVYDLIFSIQP